MAVVLPMAGVERYVCTMDMEFSGNLDDCPMTGDDCGGGDHELPDCMVTTDLVPDAEPPNLAQIPFLKADEVIYLRISVTDLKANSTSPARMEHRRGPPDSREWYVKQQRLLI
jgi:hypothetical protein